MKDRLSVRGILPVVPPDGEVATGDGVRRLVVAAGGTTTGSDEAARRQKSKLVSDFQHPAQDTAIDTYYTFETLIFECFKLLALGAWAVAAMGTDKTGHIWRKYCLHH